MKIVLDTTNKIIKIEESANLGELMITLDKILPMNEWKEFRLETNTQIIWSNPITIHEYRPVYPYPYPWYNPPTIQYLSGGYQGTPQLQSGSYCIEI